ncbi:MAG TPA: prephenate dehydratase [Thermomicrobiales bacterium]|nr:prephenate dehydratase [Thermomicrobiales bacterium]
MAVAYLGPRGTYSEEAAIMFAGDDAELIPCSGFPAVVAAVESGAATAGMLPVENSIEGPVTGSLDLLIHETDLKLCYEVVVPIRHVLVAKEGVRLEEIRTVMSHPQALAQCREFLERELPDAEQVAWMSTGGAIETVATGEDRTVAAIGPRRSQQLYGGEVIAEDIQDARMNLTRFMAFSHEDAEPTGDDITLMFLKTDKDEPGSLFRVLEPLAREHIQLTNLITRPTKGWLGEYVFVVYFQGHRKDPVVARALDGVRKVADEVRVIGSCPRFPLEQYRHLAGE